MLIQNDLHRLFEFIEPADKNLNAYSFRTHELLLRSCVEVEANCKAILTENGYQQNRNLTMNDYRKLNATHRLSSYEIILPVWNGQSSVRKPFAAWSAGEGLPWYGAYNATKHDRYSVFHEANLEQTIDAVAGLLVLLSAQFHTDDFAPASYLKWKTGDRYDGTAVGIGGYFQVRFPTDWPEEDRYDFHWQLMMTEEDPFGQLTFAQ
ncbi:MAG: hypothetical protein ACJ796_14415 [Gemmatimonadaceae bacterium]